MGKQKPHHFFGEVFCISLIFIQLQYAHKRFLRNLYVSDLAHSLLSFFLFFQQLFLTGNITAVALGKHVFSHCSDGFSCDDLASYCCLDRDFKSCLGISSLSFSHIFLPRSYAVALCTIKESASTSSLLIRISSFTSSDCSYPSIS